MKRINNLLLIAASFLLLTGCEKSNDKPVIIIDGSDETSQNTETKPVEGSEEESEPVEVSESEESVESKPIEVSESESTPDTPVDPSSITLTHLETYNDEYMRFQYSSSPFDFNGHICKEIKYNNESVWYEDLPALSAFNVRVVNVKLTSYTFGFADDDGIYLTLTANIEQEGGENPDQPYTPGEIVDFGLSLVDAYNDIYVKVSYTSDPFNAKYGFSYYTVNDGEHKTWKVKDGTLYQLQLGTNDAGEYTIKFYNETAQYGFGNIKIS